MLGCSDRRGDWDPTEVKQVFCAIHSQKLCGMQVCVWCHVPVQLRNAILPIVCDLGGHNVCEK